ncbi:MAG: DUF1410 domain-containing protein [Ureaplasma parvum]|nr:DUF1410 domain-containing protein [Ureaplasma parvum]MBS5833124.1 DUF1410 domain-containing protein [Ureaplasma parvum]
MGVFVGEKHEYHYIQPTVKDKVAYFNTSKLVNNHDYRLVKILDKTDYNHVLIQQNELAIEHQIMISKPPRTTSFINHNNQKIYRINVGKWLFNSSLSLQLKDLNNQIYSIDAKVDVEGNIDFDVSKLANNNFYELVNIYKNNTHPLVKVINPVNIAYHNKTINNSNVNSLNQPYQYTKNGDINLIAKVAPYYVNQLVYGFFKDQNHKLHKLLAKSENSVNKLISIIESLQPDDYNPYYSIEKQENKQKDENNSQATYNGLEHQIKSLKSIINLFDFNITNLSIDAIYNLNDELIKKFQKANSQINDVVIQIKQTILSNFKQTYLFKDFIKHLKEFNIALNNENDPIKKANRIQTIQEVLKSYEKDLFLNTKINLKLAPNEVLTVNNLEKIDLTYASDLLQKPQELIAYLKLNNNQEREFSKELENLSVRVFTIIDKKLYIPKAKELIDESKKIIQTKDEHANNKTKLQRLEKFTSFVEQGISNENVSSYTLNLYIQRLTKLIQEIKKPQH